MKRIIVIMFSLAASALLLAPPLSAQQRWQRTYGGTDNDQGYSVQQTSGGGYIVVGEHDYYGAQVYLIKTNASGDTLWSRIYGGAGGGRSYSVQQTSDGGYVLAGWTSTFGNGFQVYLIKTNAGGDTLWSRTYGGVGDEWGYSVQQTQDGGYIIAGRTTSFGDSQQVYLIKTDAEGDTLWTRTYGGTGVDEGQFVQQTSDGGYIIAGGTTSFGNESQVYLIKTNAGGDTLWVRTYGGTGSDGGSSVQQTSDGGYIVAGTTRSFGNQYQVCLIKTNLSGDTLWTKTYGGTGDEFGRSVQQTTDGGYIIAGQSASFGNGFQVYLIKTNAAGDTLWTRTYGGTGDDVGYSVRQTSDGGYIIAGGTTSFGLGEQVYLIKTDANGNVGTETADERGQKLEVRLKPKPNPFTSFASVPGQEKETFELYDIAGRKVGFYRGDRIGANLPAGVYFLRTSGGPSTPVRIVKVR